MARPKSEEKRQAILAAAIRVIAVQGVGAPTSQLAKEAGVSNGTLFTYFETKADLLNHLYLELKAEMAEVILGKTVAEGDIRAKMLEVWSRWLGWSASMPEKRRALAHLTVSDEITPSSREAGNRLMADFGGFVRTCCAAGALRDAPVKFVAAMMNALAETTIDFMIQDPDNADRHCATSFEALWRMVS